MTDVKRYFIDAYYSGTQREEDSDGPWVEYEDVEDYITELEAKNKRLVEAAGLVVNMWFQAPDAGNLPVALDELREALASMEKDDE